MSENSRSSCVSVLVALIVAVTPASDVATEVTCARFWPVSVASTVDGFAKPRQSFRGGAIGATVIGNGRMSEQWPGVSATNLTAAAAPWAPVAP